MLPTPTIRLTPCKYCGKALLWSKRPEGFRLMNPDGTVHIETCKNKPSQASPKPYDVNAVTF